MRKPAAALIMAFLIIAVAGTQQATPPLAKGQVPTPPDVPTLGPPIIVSSGSEYTNVKIISPINQTNHSGEVQLKISIDAVGLLGQFGNVGYSLDGGTINSIKNMAKTVDDKTGYPDWYYYKTTATASLSLTNLIDGFHSVTVYYGWQYTGRFEVFAYSKVDFTYGNSVATPEIYIKSPSNQSLTNDNSPVLSFYLRQVQAMATSASIYYSLDGENYAVANISKAGMGGIINKVTPFTQKIANLSDGLHFLSVYAQVYYSDSWLFEGNSSIQFTVDASPPEITQLSIVNKTYNDQSITLSFDLNENASWIAYNLDNQGNITLGGNTTLTGLSFGSHQIVVYANDSLGNMGASETVTFAIAVPEPFPFVPVASIAVVAVAAVAAGLLLARRKHRKEARQK